MLARTRPTGWRIAAGTEASDSKHGVRPMYSKEFWKVKNRRGDENAPFPRSRCLNIWHDYQHNCDTEVNDATWDNENFVFGRAGDGSDGQQKECKERMEYVLRKCAGVNPSMPGPFINPECPSSPLGGFLDEKCGGDTGSVEAGDR